MEIADLGFDEEVLEESFPETTLAVLMMDIQRVLRRAKRKNMGYPPKQGDGASNVLALTYFRHVPF